MTVGIAVAFWVGLLAARLWVWHGMHGSVTVSAHRGKGYIALYAIGSSVARRLRGFASARQRVACGLVLASLSGLIGFLSSVG